MATTSMPHTLTRARKCKFKLPTGQTVATDDPIREFKRNVNSRWRMLLDAGLAREFHLVRLWETDALNQRRGILTPEDRSRALGMNSEQFAAFRARVSELNRDVWSKAEDFYRGLLASGLFERAKLVRLGIYMDHRLWDWATIELKYRVSRETIIRRVNTGIPLASVLAPARELGAPLSIIHLGNRYSVAEFSKAFGLSKPHVRTLAMKGLSAEEILTAPRPRRGRPCGTLSVERASTHSAE